MKTREKLLQLLISKQDSWISGEAIAEELGITRAAVWKNINLLRDSGYTIDAVRNRGYRLLSETDILSELGIWKYLGPECRDLDIHIKHEVKSTNDLLREKAIAGSPDGTVLIAEMQTEGRGRSGRKFYSPADTGIYMSLLLRPVEMDPSKVLKFTTAAAVAVCQAIETVSDTKPQIKWVNDVFLNGKKVCGILTEGSMSFENGEMDHVILGIGINVYRPEDGFPEEIRNTAGYLFENTASDTKNKLAAAVLNNFMKFYRKGDFRSYINEYRKRLMVIGKDIFVVVRGENQSCEVLDIDEDCRLVVRFQDGKIEHLVAGEINSSSI